MYWRCSKKIGVGQSWELKGFEHIALLWIQNIIAASDNQGLQIYQIWCILHQKIYHTVTPRMLSSIWISTIQ